MRLFSLSALIFICSFAIAAANSRGTAPLPSQAEIASFWDNVFSGASPYGVPPLNGNRFNQRTVNNCTAWDVRFDSYKDPVTDLPVGIGGVFAIPNNVPAPGPGGTYPGLIVTHSVGEGPPAGIPADDVEAMSTWFAQKGFATLAFYMRGWGTSPMSVAVDLFTDNLASAGGQPLDHRFTGMAVDCFQAGEFLAAQPEVWDANNLTFVGHSGGGFAVMAAGVFSTRFGVLAASAPAGAWPDAGDWLDYVWGNGGFLEILNWINSQPEPTEARALVERSLTFISMYNCLDNPLLKAKNPAWDIDDVSIFFYGGENDTSIPADDVAANFDLANPSSPDLKAMHRSPTGGHGGPESWNRTQAWVAGHYPGAATQSPVANLTVTSNVGATATFSSAGSLVRQYDWDYGGGAMSSSVDDIVSLVYDFGDGTSLNAAENVSHTYAAPERYAVTLTITDGAGLRDVASVPVTISDGTGGGPQLDVVSENPEVVPEGGESSFLVRLTGPPSGIVNVQVNRTGGDSDISVSAGAVLGFSSANWNVFHPVTLAAAEDADKSSDIATISVSAFGLDTVDITALERDDEAEFAIVVGGSIGSIGNAAVVPIALINKHNAPVASISMTVNYDGSVFTNADAISGPDLPGPAWWSFDDEVSAPGEQSIDAAEFVQPVAPVISGGIIADVFTIGGSAIPGVYPIVPGTATINGENVADIQAGFISVTLDCEGIPGDMNDDGDIDPLDIPSFVEALIDPQMSGACGVAKADLDGDDIANGLDLQLFAVAVLQS